MSVKPAVQKLNADLKHLAGAQRAESRAKTTEAKAEGTEKTDRTQEQAALAGIASQTQGIVDRFEATSPALSPAQQQALLGQMYTLGEQQVQTQDRFTAKLATDHRAIGADARDVSKDQRTVSRDLATARGALRPAEYDLSLAQTNQDRKALGLGTVSKVIRPAVEQSVPGTVGKWIAEAQSALEAAGIPASKMNAADIDLIIQHESSGNPDAVNNWDSNAAAGHPSEGLMQTIAPTFNEYKLPGHNDILNPVDNIIAGVRYAIARYGSISDVPGVVAVKEGRPYVGY